MKRFLVLAGLLMSMGTAMAQYGNPGTGGGLPSNDSPPPQAPPGTIGNPPPKAQPVKFFDGQVLDITGRVVTVTQQVVIPGQPVMSVEKKFELQDSTLFDPADWKPELKAKVRVIYEPKEDKLVITKVIRDSSK
jgi:hypothetical protein